MHKHNLDIRDTKIHKFTMSEKAKQTISLNTFTNLNQQKNQLIFLLLEIRRKKKQNAASTLSLNTNSTDQKHAS